MKDPQLILFCASAGPQVSDNIFRSQEADVISFAPQHNQQQCPFPLVSTKFVFPLDIQFREDKQSKLQTHYFNFPNIKGRNIFGVASVFKLRVDMQIQNILIKNQVFKETVEEIYADYAIYMLFSEPVHHHFVQFLEFHANKIIKGELDIRVTPEVLINHFSQRKPPIILSYGDCVQSLIVKSDLKEIKIQGILTNGVTAIQQTGLIYRKLKITLIVDVIEALLQERTVLFTSQNQQICSQLVYEMLALLYPFNYPFPFYSTLPQSYIPLLHSPIPLFGSLTYEALDKQILPPTIMLVDVDESKIIEMCDFKDYGVMTRHVIPKVALSKMNLQFFYKIANKQQKPLLNTMNYKGSDSQYIPQNVKVQIQSQVKSIFKKSNPPSYQDMEFPENQMVVSQTQSLIPCSYLHHIIPYWQTGSLYSLQMEINERLFYYNAVVNLRLSQNENSLARRRTMSIDQSNQFSPCETPRAPQRGLLLRDDLHVIDVSNIKKPVFKAIEFSNTGKYHRPSLPIEIKQLIIKVLEQNANFYKKKEVIPKSVSKEQISHLRHNIDEIDVLDESDDDDDELLPNPQAMIYDTATTVREQKQLGYNQGQFTEDEIMESLKIFPSPFYPVGASIKSITPSQKEVICRFVKNTSQDLIVEPSKVIDVPRVRVGICSALLQLVCHYRKSINLQLDNKHRLEISQFIQNAYDVVIDKDSERVVMSCGDTNTQKGIRNLLQDIMERRAHDQKQTETLKLQKPFSKFFDYRTFIAEAPTQFRPFLEYFAFSTFFEAFLESRLCEQVRAEGATLSTLAQGYFFAQHQHKIDSTMNPQSSIPGLSLGQFSTIKGLETKMSVDLSQSSESRPDSPLTFHSESDPDVNVQISLTKAKNEVLDLVDMLQRTQEIIPPNEDVLLSQPHCFLIMKQGVGEDSKWNVRSLTVARMQNMNVQVIWKDGQTVKGEMLIGQSEVACVPIQQNNFPTPYPVRVTGKVVDRGRESDRRIVFCFQNPEEQRRFLLLTRPPQKSQNRERYEDGIASQKMYVNRKARKYAIGMIQYNLERGSANDVLAWTTEFSQIK